MKYNKNLHALTLKLEVLSGPIVLALLAVLVYRITATWAFFSSPIANTIVRWSLSPAIIGYVLLIGRIITKGLKNRESRQQMITQVISESGNFFKYALPCYVIIGLLITGLITAGEYVARTYIF